MCSFAERADRNDNKDENRWRDAGKQTKSGQRIKLCGCNEDAEQFPLETSEVTLGRRCNCLFTERRCSCRFTERKRN